MSLTKCVSNVKTLNGYASFTDDLLRQDYKVPFNIGTILSLKKIRSFEIDYFTKYKENGAAFLLLKRLLQNPASKSWGLLGKEIASLLQYWLEGVKKYLIVYCPQWWRFLKSLLDFINDFIPKDPSISNVLIKSSSESHLELACIATLNVDQQLQVVASLGNISGAASKELLYGLQKQYSVYFTKLSHLFLTCEVALQYSVLELFTSWGVSPELPSPAAKILAERHFTDFYKDSRELLNALNKCEEDITSVPCKNIHLGEVDISASSELWLDISSKYGRLSIILPPPARGLLIVTEDAVSSVTLQRNATQEVQLSIALSDPPFILRSAIKGILKNPGQILKITFSMEDMKKIDKALKTAFTAKYEKQTNTGDESFSKETSKVNATSQDNAKRSELPKRIDYGLKVRGQTQAGWKSPSTASTTSLAQLHEKLAAFPRLRSDREFPTVCAQPDLSIVTEISEYDYESRKSGVVTRRRIRKAITSPSDEEIGKERIFLSSPNRYLYRSPSKSPNCLLTSTIGPLDRTDPEKNIIIDQILKEAFQKDVLLDSGINTDKNSSQVPETEPIVTKNVKNLTVISSSEEQASTVKEDSRFEYSRTSDKASKKEAYKSTTTDESNTEAINDTPYCYVNARRKPKQVERNFKEIGDLQPVAVDDVLEFFEQHFNTAEDLPISPTLARKINASSDSSESFDQIINESQKMDKLQVDDVFHMNNEVNEPMDDVDNNRDVRNTSKNQIDVFENTVPFEVDENDVLGCLVSMIDKVCEDLDKCTVMTDQEVVIQIIEAEEKSFKNEKPVAKKSKMPKIKLTFKKTAAKKTKKAVKNNKLELEPAVQEKSSETPKPAENLADENKAVDIPYQDIDEIKEQVPNIEDITEPKRKTNDTTIEEPNTPFMVRRKRKLYSPNDDNEIQVLETIEIKDKPESKLKTTATSYKDIERDRKIFRRSRNRKSNSEPKSPRTLKNDNLFESLKENIDNKKDIVLVDVVKKTRDKKMAVYNFSSSEDSDDAFKPLVRKSASLDNKNKRKVKPKMDIANSEEPKTEKGPKKERKKRAKKTPVAKTLAKYENTLVDERMREANPDLLEQSFLAEEPQEVIETPKKVTKRSMEGIPVDDPDVIENTLERNVKILKIKKEKGLKKQKLQEQKKKPKSPEEELPPLIIEEMAKDDKSSTSSRFAKKIQRIMKDGCIDETNTTHDLLDADRPSSPEIQTEIQMIDNAPDYDDTRKIMKTSRNNDLQFIDDEKENIRYRKKTKKLSQTTNEIELSDNDHEYKDPSTTKEKKSQKCIEEIDLIDNINDNNDTQIKTNKLSQKSNKIEAKDSHIKKTNTKKCPPIETVDITSRDQSERSISTCHGNSPITAHGDMDEAPPSPELLNEVYSPRNLNIQNLLAKEYKQQLRKGLRYHSSDSKHSKDTQKLAQSPVVSITRLSLDEIRSNLKPRKKRNDSCDSKSSQKSNESQKSVPKSLSPVVSVKRMSPEDIKKWLPSPKSSTTGDAEVEMINFNTKERIEKDIVKKYPVKMKVTKASLISKTDKNEQININKAEVEKSMEKSSNESLASPKFKGTVRKSMISPIIIDFDEYLQEFIGADEMTKLSEKSKSNITLKPQRYILRQDTSTTERSGSSKITLIMKKMQEIEIPRKIRKIDCPGLERSPKSNDIPRNMRKVASPSSESTEKVRQWLERADSSKQDEDKHGICEDCIKYVIEKIDTTLLEIHQDTNESWMNLLVEQEISQREIIKEIVTKCKEMFGKLSVSMRSRAAAALQRDCSRKRAFLAALVSELNEMKR